MHCFFVLLSCLVFCRAADAVQITKPVNLETAVTENIAENAVVTNSGHYATASGTSFPYNWSSIPAAAVVWDLTPDPQYRHTVRFMIMPGQTGPVVIKVNDTGDGTSHSITVYPVALSWVDNWNGFGGGPGPDRIVNNGLGGLRGTRKLYFYAIGTAAIADLRIRMYANKQGATGQIEVLEFDDEASSVAEVTPPCGTGEWQVVIPVSTSPQGVLHSLTIQGTATSALMDDIEIDLVDRQSGATTCYDGIGAVLEYTVVETDLVFEDLDEQEEEDGAYLAADSAPHSARIKSVLPSDFTGTIRLDTSDPGGRLSVASQSGPPIVVPHDLSANTVLPFDCYALAIAPSAAIEDIELFMEPTGQGGQAPIAGLLTWGRSFPQRRRLESEAEVGSGVENVAL